MHRIAPVIGLHALSLLGDLIRLMNVGGRGCCHGLPGCSAIHSIFYGKWLQGNGAGPRARHLSKCAQAHRQQQRWRRARAVWFSLEYLNEEHCCDVRRQAVLLGGVGVCKASVTETRGGPRPQRSDLGGSLQAGYMCIMRKMGGIATHAHAVVGQNSSRPV